MVAKLLLGVAILHCVSLSHAFRGVAPYQRRAGPRVNMIFDFIKQRSLEGMKQMSNIAEKTLEGKLGEALQDSASYVKTRQKIDAENFKKLTDGLAKSRQSLLGGISSAFGDKSLAFEKRLSKLEEVLLQADIGVATTRTILQDLKSYVRQYSDDLSDADIVSVLRERLIQSLTPASGLSQAFTFAEAGTPTVLFIIGANGMGKTTSIGKLAYRFKNEGNMTVLLGACDTFRAAAVEQLNEWALRANVSIELPTDAERGGDPVPVVTRTLRRAKAEQFDLAVIDTSGRLSNNFELIEQLQAMKSAIVAEVPSGPHETLLVVDGSVGRNAVDQARAWMKYVGVTGLVVTKLDGTARGGFIVSVVKELGIPVKLIGVGEKIGDLRDFSAEAFVDALLGTDPAKADVLKAKVNKIFNIAPVDALAANMQSGSGSSGTERLAAMFESDDAEEGGTGGAAVAKRKTRKTAQQKKKKNTK